jgi:hypothetical protein
VSFLRKNHTFHHLAGGSYIGKQEYGSTPDLDRTKISTLSHTAASVSEPSCSQARKKYFHKSKWGSIAMQASHRVMKGAICRTPEGVK